MVMGSTRQRPPRQRLCSICFYRKVGFVNNSIGLILFIGLDGRRHLGTELLLLEITAAFLFEKPPGDSLPLAALNFLQP
jgi:hypothetical protein